MERESISRRVVVDGGVPSPLVVESFRALIEHSSDLVSVLDRDGNWVYASPSHERIMGYAPAELIGRNAFEIIHPDDRERVGAIVSAGMQQTAVTDVSEARFLHRDGTWRVIEGTLIAHFEDPLIGGAVVNARDITERRRAEQLRSAYARELERRQHTLQELVFRTTHDLKAPVCSIGLIADQLLRRAGHRLEPDDRDEIAFIERLAAGTEDMLRDLLDFLRLTAEPETATWVDLAALVARAVEQLRPQIERKRVVVAVGELPRVWGRARQLAHAVDNLVGNAVKYVAAGQGRIQISGWSDDMGVILSVGDNGIGVPAAFQQRIFELFGRVPEVRVDGEAVGGTGVGLAIVREVAEAHGGSVSVDSTEGRGSRFDLRLPARPALMLGG